MKNIFFQRIKNKFKPGEPIFTKDLLLLFPEYTRAYVFRLLNKTEQEGKLVCFSRGIYCIPKQTIIGPITISARDAAEALYISNGESIYGIYSGLSLLNYLTSSTQVPNIIEIITNNEATRKRNIEINGMKFILRKSRFEITKSSYSYYTILQLFLELGVRPKFDEFTKQLIIEYIKNKKIQKEKLFEYAMYFPAQTIKNLVGSEILNEAF